MLNKKNILLKITLASVIFILSINQLCNGDSWVPINNGLEDKHTTSLISIDNILYAVVSDKIYYTIIGENNWLPVSNGVGKYINILCTMNEILYAGTGIGSETGSAYRCENGCASWTNIFRCDSQYRRHVSALYSMNGELYLSDSGYGGRIYKSVDGGDSWIRLETFTDPRTELFYSVGNTLYISLSHNTGGGLYKTTDNGETWTLAKEGGLPGLPESLDSINNILFAGITDKGIFKSSNKGDNWTTINYGLTSQKVSTVQASKGILYAGTSDQGVFKSIDKGNHWLPMNTGLTTKAIEILYSTEDGTLYAGTTEGVFVFEKTIIPSPSTPPPPYSPSWWANNLKTLIGIGASIAGLASGVLGTYFYLKKCFHNNPELTDNQNIGRQYNDASIPLIDN